MYTRWTRDSLGFWGAITWKKGYGLNTEMNGVENMSRNWGKQVELTVLTSLFSWTAVLHVWFYFPDNPPYCLRHRYRRVISEGVEPGFYILNVLASDLDEESNAKLRYYLTGTGAEYFSLDKSAGMIYSACFDH